MENRNTRAESQASQGRAATESKGTAQYTSILTFDDIRSSFKLVVVNYF
jgi:hypothetical protein